MNKDKRQGKVSNQTADVVAPETTEDAKFTVVGSHADFPNVKKATATFRIIVKDDNDVEVYNNKKEPFTFYILPEGNITEALAFEGAKLSDDQKTLLSEALKPVKDEKGVETADSKTVAKALTSIVKVLNADLKTSAAQNRRSAITLEKTPKTEEQIDNANVRMVRSYLTTHPGISDEVAIATLSAVDVIPKDFTVEDYRDSGLRR